MAELNFVRRELFVVLPFPNRLLFPNSRPNRFAKARHVKTHRWWARLAVQEQITGPVKPHGKIRYYLDYTPKTNQHRDEDNIIAACKAYLDGIADALGVNDRLFTIGGVESEPASLLHSQIVIRLVWTELDETMNG